MQADEQAAVSHHRVGMAPCLADRRLREAEALVEGEGLQDVRRVYADLEEPSEHGNRHPLPG